MTENTINFMQDLSSMLGMSNEAIASFFLIMIVILIGFYVFQSLAWQTIGRKQNYKRPWLAWIPFANISMILQMGRFHWAWVFLAIVPTVFLGNIASAALIALLIIAQWRIFEKAGYKGWLAILTLVPLVGLIVLGIVAWRISENKIEQVKKITSKKVAKKSVKKIVKKVAKKKVSKKVTKKKTSRKAKK